MPPPLPADAERRHNCDLLMKQLVRGVLAEHGSHNLAGVVGRECARKRVEHEPHKCKRVELPLAHHVAEQANEHRKRFALLLVLFTFLLQFSRLFSRSLTPQACLRAAVRRNTRPPPDRRRPEYRCRAHLGDDSRTREHDKTPRPKSPEKSFK